MRWKQPRSDDTKQIHGSEKFAKADPKAGSKIRSKNRSPHKGPPLNIEKKIMHDFNEMFDGDMGADIVNRPRVTKTFSMHDSTICLTGTTK